MDLIEQLNDRPDLNYLLFRRGWYVCNDEHVKDMLNKFPFYGTWRVNRVCSINFITHPDTHINFFYSKKHDVNFFLLGHSYNPFTKMYEESKQLEYLAEAFPDKKLFQERIDQLTGVFVLGWIQSNKNIQFVVDASGIQSVFYGTVDEHFIMTSHPQLAADIYNWEIDENVKEIIDYKWYPRVLGSFLPGDLCQYKSLKRVIPNMLYTYNLCSNNCAVERIFPTVPILEATLDSDYDKVISDGANLLKKSIDLIIKKWNAPAISLTGGVDSQTTFAAANGNYGKISTFSYLSNHEESIDVIAAKQIAKRFKVPYRLYEIPTDSSNIDDYDLKSAILEHNSGYIAVLRPNEIRKRIVLERDVKFDVEIKSWVSETIRACQYKRYRKKTMPGLSPKLFRNLYKIFITNRRLAHKVDKIFEEYIEKYFYEHIPAGYDMSDMYFWEVGWGAWGSINVSEMMIYGDLTCIYNNRKFLALLLRTPLNKRINDQNHRDLRKSLNKELFDMDIEVVNMSEDWRRALFLRVIFELNMLFCK